MAFQFFIVIVFLLSFFACYLTMPFFISKIKKRGLTGIDMNKLLKPKIPELGGISVWLGFSLGVMSAIFLATYFGFISLNLVVLLAGFSTIVMVGFLGLVDDLIGWKKGIEQWQHAIVPLFASLPLAAIKLSVIPIMIPFFGFLPETFKLPFFENSIPFAVFYSIVLVPIGITGASNAINMLAGFNGLEAGLGSVILFTLAVISLFTGKTEAFVLAVSMLAALLAFLSFNWYPAKVFGGDSLTLMTGATIASVSIIGDMEKIGVLLMSLYFLEFAIKAKHGFASECFGVPQKDGTLKPDPRGGSLTQTIMSLGSFTEKQVVIILIFLQAIISIIVFLLFYFKMLAF